MGLYTHIHTHTIQFNEINKEAKVLAFISDIKKTDYIYKYSLSFRYAENVMFDSRVCRKNIDNIVK